MEIYCDRCEFKREYGEEQLPRVCPKCGSLDLRFEEDIEWNPLCSTWAFANGWKGQRNSDPHLNSSLPEWYCREGKLIEWDWFKATLMMPEYAGPPPVDQNDSDDPKFIKAANYWFRRTGIIDIWQRGRKNMKNLLLGDGGKLWREDLEIVKKAAKAANVNVKVDLDEWSEEKIRIFVLSNFSVIQHLLEYYMVYWEKRGLYTPPNAEKLSVSKGLKN